MSRLDMGASMGLIVVIVGGVLAFVIVGAMFPTIDTAAAGLVNATQNSNNELIRALSPVVPYLTGIGLFSLIAFPIYYVYKRVS